MTKLHGSSRNGSIIHFGAWRDGLGISATTGWRWRKRGWIDTITIAGRVYISQDATAAFERRAAGGGRGVLGA
jgi:predicted site-specific integrase-resolvase